MNTYLKLKHFLLATAVCLTCSSKAQNLEVVWGKETKPDKRTYIGGVIGHDKNGYYLFKRVGGGLFSSSKTIVDRQNMDHEVEFSNEINEKINGKDAYYESSYMLDNDRLVVFQSQRDKKADINKLYVTFIEKNGRSTQPKLVDEIDLKKKKGTGEFNTRLSDDKKKFLIFHAEGYDKKDNEKVNYKMYTTDFELIWEKAIELPYKDKKFSIGSYTIDEEGNVYLYGVLSIDKKISKHKLFAYYHKKGALEEVNVEFGKAAFISDMRFNYYNNALHFMGFYYDGKNDGIQGIFYTKINAKTLRTEIEKNSPFTKKDLSQFATARQIKRGKGIRTNFDIDDIIIKPNGEMYLVAEEYYVQVVTSTDSKGGTRTTYYYHYEDIIVVNMTADADIIWARKIPKYQISVNDGGYYSSYILAYDEKNLYFLYNDNLKNTSPKTKPEKRGTYVTQTQKIRKLVVTLATLSNTGELSTEMFFKSKSDGKTVLKPKYYQRFSPDKILIYAERGKTYKFGFLNIN